MKPAPLLFIISVLCLSASAMADNDDWIGLEAEPATTRIGLLLSRDQQQNSTQNIYLQHALTSSSRIDINYSQDRLSQPEQSFHSADVSTELSFDLNLQWRASIGYQFQGQTNELDIEQFKLRFEYTPDPAFMSAQWSSGTVILYSREDLPAYIQAPHHVDSDLDSLAVELGWWFDKLSLSARYQDFDYQRDLSPLQFRPLLQLLVKPGALAQTGLLISRQASINLDIPLESDQIGAHWLSSTSAINHGTTHTLQLDWIHTLGKQLSSMIFISRNQGDEANWTLSAGLEWNG